MASKYQKFPPQSQETQPGKQYLMNPLPISTNPQYKPSNKLQGKVALVTGGDSGIGRAVCYYFALEGANVAFTYVKGPEDRDADDALALIREAAKENDAGEPIAILADLRLGEDECKKVVDKVVSQFGCIDVLVNNAAVQYYKENIEDITEGQLRTTFEINIFAYIFMAKHAMKHMKEGSSIINSSSALAYIGEQTLVDYSSTKGAIVSFTRSLGLQLIKRGIRVNGVAPGPIWTPLEVASLPVDRVVTFGKEAAMDRAGQPFELAPSYVFLASNECSSYLTGQFLHPNGGMIVNA
ncbi:glucose and ribitol dehydrogenase-like [Chenopodium quinoa]|uniref:glucose and ribitol dehydrogenase-like n=1 Tax=Chenopodium quinoa TaxID=63459 RepID=UPI000B791E00|nr:glucose and ribitol dehydrogenase-like [Chenopodium quinoa]XP_021750338.1 glucose and ribitol dehydrogenase-like [Chenopodium quinoa]